MESKGKTSSIGSEAYDYAYSVTMQRIEEQSADQSELAKNVLAWITCAQRPITAAELQEALGVREGELIHDVDNRPDIYDMVSTCAGLVTVDEGSDIIRLVHYTTQDYLERTQQHWFPDAEAMITAICITYLSSPEFVTGPIPAQDSFAKTFFGHAALEWGHTHVVLHQCIHESWNYSTAAQHEAIRACAPTLDI